MPLTAILAAADKTPDGRHAIQAAAQLASATGARLTLLEVVRLGSEGTVPTGRVASTRDPGGPTGELAAYAHWIGPIEPPVAPERTEVAVAYGIPGIEIGRLADQRAADLVVLGRRPRSADHPLILGETADAVVRRSPRPVLFVPPAVTAFHRVLVALDGTERTVRLLRPAYGLANALGGQVIAVTVLPGSNVGSDQAAARLKELIARASLPTEPITLTVRAGDPVEEILTQAEETRPAVLVIGYRRGGPPKVIGPTDIARNLLYAAPTAVLTIPL
ncbi:MAG: universal stress protein [Gemmatimonadales bacterium]